jgi:hypothetical protein
MAFADARAALRERIEWLAPTARIEWLAPTRIARAARDNAERKVGAPRGG